MRSTSLLIYLGSPCRVHRCTERLVETQECVECVGRKRLRQIELRSERRTWERQVHRVLHEMSDGGKTVRELVNTTGLSATNLRPLLDQLASSGTVVFAEERTGHHSRWVWSLQPRAEGRRRPCA